MRNFIKYSASIVGISILCALLAGCRTYEQPDEIIYIATIPPIAMILTEIVGDRGEVVTLLQPGASPHTYDPTASDAIKLINATAFFYVHESLDGWALSLESKNKIKVFDFVPKKMRLSITGHNFRGQGGGKVAVAGPDDPHFWTDPMVVAAVVPGLVDELSKLDREGASIYEENASVFIEDLKRLDSLVREFLADFTGSWFILFHPSFNYFFEAYGLKVGAYIEASPGKEPSAQYLVELIGWINNHDVKAIFTEPQLPRGPADTIAKETGLPVFILDPIGGVGQRVTYEKLIQYITDTIIQASIDKKNP
jgi:zinc transport system substrate-binding protein